jgi:uncharacterized protein with HEPN domain
MPYSDTRNRLEHILDGIEWAERFTAGMTLAGYRGDRATRDAVERNLERISEASSHIPDAMKASHPQIPWSQVASLGNRLRHGYEGIDDSQIWNIVRNDLPALRTVATAMLADLPEED